MLLYLLLNGFFFHCQTISAYYLMDFISPVTHSVANTGKRAFLIWTSVLLFGNEVTFLSGLGTVVVILGVFLYNAAQQVDAVSSPRLVQVGAKKLFIEKV
jgi:solute carrier family 35 protein E2